MRRVSIGLPEGLTLTIQAPLSTEGSGMLSKDKLEALARYAPILEARGIAWGEWKIPPGQVPWMEHGDVASSFMDDAYRYDWVSGDFDWPRWSRTAEARRLR